MKKSAKKRKGTRAKSKQQIPSKDGKNISYIFECRYCTRKAPAHLHAQILSKLKEAQSTEGKGRFLVCKNCFPRYTRDVRVKKKS